MNLMIGLEKQNQKEDNKKEGNKKLEVEEAISRLYPYIIRVFDVYEVQASGNSLYFYGTPKTDAREVETELWMPFHQFGFMCTLKYELGEHFLLVVPEKKENEKVWINLILFITTVFTTMICGAGLFGVDTISDPSQLLIGLPFTLAIMAILFSHEMAHYIMARYHGMEASLPYFIPIPFFIGTMGAVIRYKGPVPSRKALFDVGIAGPLVGLLVSIAVTFVGLNLRMPTVKPLQNSIMLDLGTPPLFLFIQRLVGAADVNLHPVAFAGWVGMFITLLNLLPSGQLDGGHILRAMLGEKAERISFLMPRLLFLLGIYVIIWLQQDGFIWIFWALLLWALASAGHPSPLQDKIELDRRRILIGILMFILGLLCFTLIPFKTVV